MLAWIFSCKRSSKPTPYPVKQHGAKLQKAFQAIKDNDPIMLEKLMKEEKMNPNSRDEKGFTLLHKVVISASFRNQELAIDLAKVLVDAKADVNLPFEQNKWLLTPLHSAVRRKLYVLAEFLVMNNANLNTKDNKDKKPTDYILDTEEREEINQRVKL